MNVTVRDITELIAEIDGKLPAASSADEANDLFHHYRMHTYTQPPRSAGPAFAEFSDGRIYRSEDDQKVTYSLLRSGREWVGVFDKFHNTYLPFKRDPWGWRGEGIEVTE